MMGLLRRRLRRLLTITFIATLAVVGFTTRAFCYQADVTDISGEKYFPAVKEAILKAEKSIYVVMFTVESTLSKENSKSNQLIDALIEAKNRGVDVEVILDQNVDFVQRRHAGDWETKIKSTRAYKRLKDGGIKVYYDEPARYAHAKTVVIDKKIVILGSTNWTESAFSNSIETDALINSSEMAKEILAYLKTIKIDTKIDEYLDSLGPSVPISWEFLENPKIAAQLVKDQAERAFDVYLYLLWQYDGNPQGKITLFYDDLAKHLGIYEGWTSENYRRQIIKVFKHLQDKYKLIKFEPRYAKEAAITLLNYNDTAGVYTIPNDQYFDLPDDYFNYGWSRDLSLRAKFCYLINLAYTDISDIKPFWSKSVITITDQCGDVSQDIINKGMGELRIRKLLEVKYDDLSGKPYDQRRPKMYKILKLYDPKQRELELKALEEKYGKAAYNKARKYAEIVFEENNPEVITDIIAKTKEYGPKEIARVFGEVAKKSIDNPKRNYLYVTRILGRKE